MANLDANGKNKGGRPEGALSKLSRAAREEAKASGRLPHEILLDIARGNPQTLHVVKPDGTVEKKTVGVSLDDMADAAKAAAPYYAPKISTVEVISGVTDDDLDAIIAGAAAAAGVSIGPCREGEEGEGKEGEGEQPAPAARRRVLTF